MRPKPYDSASIYVALESGFTFTMEVQDWEDDGPNLSDSAAWAMADDLVRSRVELFGVMMPPTPPVRGLAQTNGRYGCVILDPARIVAVMVTPTGVKR